MKYSGIGGQAVMEGVMMRGGDEYAVAVRLENGEIEVEKKKYKGIGKNDVTSRIPLVRGVISFIDSLYLGLSSLMFSASFFEDEDPKREKSSTEKRKENAIMGATLIISLVIAIGIFMIAPFYISQIFQKYIASDRVISFIEAVLRLVIFFGYMLLISRMKDIQRTFMYHGAEHKCINCIESGLELNVENVRKSTRFHKRCGTNFLLIVMIVTVIFFLLIQVDSQAMKLLYRIVLIPVVAGVSYEFIRLAGRYDNWFVNLINKPGLALQKLTTREPDDDQIEVGIASVNAVFDWKEFLKNYNEAGNETCCDIK